MKRAIAILVLAAFLAAAVPASFAGQGAQGKPQEFCPVMGGKISKDIYTDYKGQRIYFCCNYCPGEFAKDPEKYIRKLAQDGVTLEKTPEAGKAEPDKK